MYAYTYTNILSSLMNLYAHTSVYIGATDPILYQKFILTEKPISHVDMWSLLTKQLLTFCKFFKLHGQIR